MPRRRPTLPGRLFLWILDQAYLHTSEPCWKYGGQFTDREVRVCYKPRWHWDSHTFDRQSAVTEQWKNGNPHARPADL